LRLKGELGGVVQAKPSRNIGNKKGEGGDWG